MYPAIRRLFVFVGSGLAYVLLPDERQVDNRLNMALECASLVHSFPKQAIWRIVPRIVLFLHIAGPCWTSPHKQSHH